MATLPITFIDENLTTTIYESTSPSVSPSVSVSVTASLPYDFNKLTPSQQKLQKLFKKDKKKLIGLRVKFVANKNGSPSGNDLKALIVALPVRERSQWSILNEVNGNAEKAYLFQLEICDDKPLTPVSVKKEVMRKLVANANSQRASEATKLAGRIRDTHNEIKTLHKQIKSYEEDAQKSTDKQAEILKLPELNEDFLLGQIKMVKRHALVDSAYVTKEGNIIVKTKSLKAIINTENPNFLSYIKGLNLDIGHFIFHISYNTSVWRFFSADNLDWTCCECRGEGNNDSYHTHQDYYSHPNIGSDKSICLGGNENDVRSMWKMGQLYPLVDFMITFFSTFPHDGGSPYISHDTWLKHRFSRGDNEHYKLNAYFLEEKLSPRL